MKRLFLIVLSVIGTATLRSQDVIESKEYTEVYLQIKGFRKYMINRDKPWKYEHLVELIKGIIDADECNDTYGSIRMHPVPGQIIPPPAITPASLGQRSS